MIVYFIFVIIFHSTDGNALELYETINGRKKIDNLTVVLIKSYLFLVKLL
jgi:hypothetical protein